MTVARAQSTYGQTRMVSVSIPSLTLDQLPKKKQKKVPSQNRSLFTSKCVTADVKRMGQERKCAHALL